MVVVLVVVVVVLVLVVVVVLVLVLVVEAVVLWSQIDKVEEESGDAGISSDM